MARRKIATKDASDHAATELEYVIKKRRTFDEASSRPTVDVASAMKGERMYSADRLRDVTRVLFISQNTELLNPTQQSLDGFVNLSELFEEVHILILRTGIAPKQPVIRVADNVWIYTAAASVWWLMPSAGLEMVDDQMVFANGFRADLVVARDQFESAAVAHRLNKLYGVTTQLHVEQPRSQVSLLRKLMAKYLIPTFVSVRAHTGSMLDQLRKNHSIPDLELLPRFHNYEALIDRPSQLDLKHKHQPILFFLLYVGPLTHTSALNTVLDAAKVYLRNPRIGLIVIGDGPARREYQKRVKKMNVESQVIFERAVTDLVSYYKSANILLVPDDSTDSEEIVLHGAASGIPVIMTETERRTDLFVHGRSAFLVSPGNVSAMTTHIEELLNNVPLRHELVESAQAMIKETFHEDPAIYRENYRISIERALFAAPEGEEGEDEKKAVAEVVEAAEEPPVPSIA